MDEKNTCSACKVEYRRLIDRAYHTGLLTGASASSIFFSLLVIIKSFL